MTDRPPYWFFISDPFHTIFFRTTATVSIVSNGLLLVLITTTASMRTDNYRYLLMSFAIGDMISSLCHTWISPTTHMTEHGFFFFPRHVNDLKSENAIKGKIAVLFYVITYYETFNILAFHFIYRYMMIVQGRLRDWTANWRIRHWTAAAITFVIAQSALMVWATSYSCLTNAYSRSLDSTPFIDLYGVNISDPTVGYVVVEFRRLNVETALEEYDGPTLVTFVIILSGFGMAGSVMVVCSVFIVQALQFVKEGEKAMFRGLTVSAAMKTQQRLLFRALLVQTLVPCVFSYCPLCIIWLWPLFTGIALGPLGIVLVMTSVIFPSVDAIMIIIFIPAYRQAFKKYIVNKIRPVAETVHVTVFTISQETEIQSVKYPK